MKHATMFREPGAAQAGGYVLALAGVLVAVGLVFHPLPAGGFEEKPSILSDTPWWGLIHVAIAFGFVLCALGSMLVLLSGGTVTLTWLSALSWGAMTVGMIFFTGVALINGWVMHASLLPGTAGRRQYPGFSLARWLWAPHQSARSRDGMSSMRQTGIGGGMEGGDTSLSAGSFVRRKRKSAARWQLFACPETLVRLPDSQEALVLALGEDAVSFYSSVGHGRWWVSR